jgi:hypothetical protein
MNYQRRRGLYLKGPMRRAKLFFESKGKVWCQTNLTMREMQHLCAGK